MRRLPAWLWVGAALAVAGAPARTASAADKRAEAVARDALKKAADDYLGTEYAAGAARLEKALAVCGARRCAPATRAKLLRDLGTMRLRAGDVGAGKRAWAEALKLDPTLALNSDYETPDLRAAWDEARGASGAGGGSAGSGETPPSQPSGDFTHTPAAEQRASTPLPIYAEHGGPLGRVVVKYRSASASDWSRVELKRVGAGWGGVIPCGDVVRGAMRYWIQGFDEGGEPTASSGDPKHPFTVPIRDDISGEAPHLPGKPAPRACNDDGGAEAGGGDDSSSSGEPARGEGGGPSAPAADSGAYARFWFGVSAEVPELVQMPAGDDLCKLSSGGVPASSANTYCTNPSGSDFPSRQSPAQNSALATQGQAGHSDGGVKLGDVRVMLAADYALSASWLLGARLGYVLDAYPGQAAVHDGRAFGSRLHAEARVTYLFGESPLSRVGFAPMIFLGAGVSEFDGHVASVVTLDNVAGQQPVNIWITDGPFFVALGGGVRYQFSQRAAFTAALRLNAAFGGNGLLPTAGPELGVLYGF